MAKRSYKRSSRQDSVNAGCTWTLISMFNFRHGGFAWKLLSDRIHVNERHAGNNHSQCKCKFRGSTEENNEDFNDNEGNRGTVIASSITSVRDLIKEEMSIARGVKKVPKYELKLLQSDLGIHMPAEKNKKAVRHRRVASDVVASEVEDASNVGSHSEHLPNPSQRNPFTYDLASFMMDFYYNNQCQEEQANSSVELCRQQENVLCVKDGHCNEISFELAHAHSVIQKALGDVANLLLEQNMVGPKSFISCREIIQSKEFMDALEVQNSIKGLLHKLLQAPNSFLSKHIEGLQNALSENPSEISRKINGNLGKNDNPVNHGVLSRRSVYRFFRKKEKLEESKAVMDTDNSYALDRIVILKPCPMGLQNLPIGRSQGSSSQLRSALNYQEGPSRPASLFSFSGMKKRLKYIIGTNRKERHLILMDAVLHKIPYGSKVLCKDKSLDNLGDTSQRSTFFRRGNKKAKTKNIQSNISGDISFEDKYKGLNLNKVAHSIHSQSFVYDGARKHLSEMLDSTYKKEIMSSRRISECLAAMLRLRDYSLISPKFSNVGESLSPRKFLSSKKQQYMEEGISNTSLHNVDDLPCHDSNPDIESQIDGPTEALANENMETNSHVEDFIMEGVYDESPSENVANRIYVRESDHMDEPLESGDNEANVVAECKVEEDDECLAVLEMGSFEEGYQQVVPSNCTPPRALFIHKAEGPERITERLDRSSPVSVLEPFFTDDTTSPDHSTTEPEESTVRPEHLVFEDETTVAPTSTITKVDEKEARFNYIRTVLELSGLCSNELSEGWNSSYQLLDISLFDEMEVSHIQLPEDVELLFDTINEVLAEIQERFFSCSPWVSHIRKEFQAVPKGENVIQKVQERIDWHLQTHFPSTLDQIVGKDLDGVSWMVLGPDTEYVVSEMGDAVLDDIVEEAIFELWE